MANGRIVNKKIVADKAINSLSSDTSRLAFTWLISFCDRDGRTYGDPCMVRSMLFPRRTDVSIEDVEKFITEWVKYGLIEWYEADGDLWISLPNFAKNQPNLRYEREQESEIPPPEKGCGPAPELLRQDSGKTPEQVRPKRREENLREENNNRAPSAAASQLVQVSEDESELYHRVKTVFEREQPGHRFTDYGKEGRAIKGLITKAQERSPDEPDAFLSGMIKQFQALRKNGDKFWRGQPFLPSALNASGIFDRVLSAAQQHYEDTKQAAENWEEIEF